MTEEEEMQFRSFLRQFDTILESSSLQELMILEVYLREKLREKVAETLNKPQPPKAI